MTTTSSLVDAQDLAEYVAALKDWPNSEFAYEEFSLAVSPFTTFYFNYAPQEFVDTTLKMVDVHEAFERLIGKKYLVATHPSSERPHPYGSKRLPDLRTAARDTPIDKQFIFNCTDESNHLSSPSFASYLWRSFTWDGVRNNTLSRIQFTYRWQWWLDNQALWRDFVVEAADLLKADQVYSGFSMANPLDVGARYEVAVWERALAPHFYGIDIEFPFGMARELQEGIRPSTWGFLLSNRWRERLQLSREQVRKELKDPAIRILERESGQWIELGEQPGLHSVADGLPVLQMRLNRMLKPIRLQTLDLVGLGQWDGDPNERFGLVDTKRWLARFDDDSDWPIRDLRQPAVPPDPRLTCSANRPCPKPGFWFTPARAGSRRYFKADESMPEIGGDYGATIWQWDQDQSPPKL